MALLLAAGCVGGSTKRIPVQSDSSSRGVASWYGPGFHGKLSASGEPFDMWAMTAAHKTLPFGTMVRVQSQETGRSVTVRINDRGPFVKGRIIDLSYGAAKELRIVGKGTEPVTLHVLNPPGSSRTASLKKAPNRYWVQAGSFTSLTQAMSLKERLAKSYSGVRVNTIQLPSGEFHRVQIGAFSSKNQAEQVLSSLKKAYPGTPKIIKYN